MQLLSPEEIKNDKRKIENEQRERIEKMKDEEKASSLRVNEALEKERKEIERIKNDTSLAQNEAECKIKKSVLLGEINALEKRKEKALEPIEKIEKEVMEKLRYANEMMINCEAAQNEAQKIKIELLEKIESLSDAETASKEKISELDKRESGIKAGEEEIKRSTKVLSEKWVEFHEGIHKIQEELKKKEKEIEDGKKANEIIKSELDIREKKQNDKQRELESNYKALAAAQKEILNKKNGKREKRQQSNTGYARNCEY